MPLPARHSSANISFTTFGTANRGNEACGMSNSPAWASADSYVRHAFFNINDAAALNLFAMSVPPPERPATYVTEMLFSPAGKYVVAFPDRRDTLPFTRFTR